MDKFKKIDREFLLTDSSLNVYGYRLLTSGYLLDEFKKNPIGYHMHADPDLTAFTRKDGALVKWEDFRTDGDKVYAKPCINLSHPRGQQSVDEIESGFLNASSVGHIVVLGVSSDPEDYLPGQKGPSVNKWFNRELSLVDIPGNYSALANLFDENNNPIKLENLTALIPQIKNMKQIFLSPANLVALSLKPEATQETVDAVVNDLIAKAAKVDQLANDLVAANAAKTKAENDLKEFKKTSDDQKVKDLCAKGVSDKKMTVEVSNKLAKQYEGKPDELKDLIDSMPAYTGVVASITSGKKDVADLASKTWDELDKSGALPDLKANNFELFKTKFKEEFKKEYPGS